VTDCVPPLSPGPGSTPGCDFKKVSYYYRVFGQCGRHCYVPGRARKMRHFREGWDDSYSGSVEGGEFPVKILVSVYIRSYFYGVVKFKRWEGENFRMESVKTLTKVCNIAMIFEIFFLTKGKGLKSILSPCNILQVSYFMFHI
jgi:hypothetical protein